MKLSTFTHPRSPWPKTIALFALLSGINIVSYLFTYHSTTVQDGDASVQVLENPDSAMLVAGFTLMMTGVALTIMGVIRTAVYVKRYPRYKQGWFLGNIELRDDDEAVSQSADRATRAAYTYNLWAYTWMIILFGLRIIPVNPFVVIFAITIAMTGMLVTYGWNMRHIEFED